MKKTIYFPKTTLFFLAGTLCLALTACGDLRSSASPESRSGGILQENHSDTPADPAENFSPQDGAFQQQYASAQDNASQQQNASTGNHSGSPQSGGAESRAQTSASPEPSPEITLVMTGDILLHTPVAQSGLQEDGSYDFSAVFAHTREAISAADLALVNQEVIIGGTGLGISGYPAFNAPHELGDALADAGFDVVLHATNHALDKGAKGITNCLAFWKDSYPDIAILGIHDSAEAQDEIYVYEQDGIKIAILNYTYGTNGIPMPQGMDYAVDLLGDLDRVADDLQRAEELADFTIVCPHWGTEYRLSPDNGQEKLAQFLWENGADLVLGTHPHVIEPVAWVTEDGIQTCDLTEQETDRGSILAGTDLPEGMLVYYSLGNFVNWTSGTGDGVANRMVGGMARITLGRNDDGTVSIKEYGIEPVVCHVEDGRFGVTVYPFSEYTEELAQKNAIRLQDGNFSLQYCHALLEQVWQRTAGTQ